MGFGIQSNKLAPGLVFEDSQLKVYCDLHFSEHAIFGKKESEISFFSVVFLPNCFVEVVSIF